MICILIAYRIIMLEMEMNMRVHQYAEITIRAPAEEIWDYANDSVHWTASNPKEHLGLRIYSEDGKARKGAAFYQKESVAGIANDLRGHFLRVERPKVAIWEGIATYNIFGDLLKLNIRERAIIKLEKTSEGVRMSQDMFMEFPDTLLGRLVLRVFRNILRGEKALHNHGYRELAYFKKQLESTEGHA